MSLTNLYTKLRIHSSNLLTPTWPLCKNILSVDYERSISFRKCNRRKSFEIVHICLNNKKCYNIQYDYAVGQSRLGQGVSEHCLRSQSRGFEPQQISFSTIILNLVKSNRPWVEWQSSILLTVAAKLRPLADKPRAAKPAHWLISPASLIL